MQSARFGDVTSAYRAAQMRRARLAASRMDSVRLHLPAVNPLARGEVDFAGNGFAAPPH